MANTWKANETQQKFMEVLKSADKPITLAKASEMAGVVFKTGSINTLTTKGLVISHKDAEVVVCECCGHKHKVSTYELA